MRKIRISDLNKLYREKNSGSGATSDSIFLCKVISEYFSLECHLNAVEQTLKSHFGRYFEFADHHETYSVLPLWFSMKYTDVYDDVTTKTGAVISMETVSAGKDFRMKLMEYILKVDPESTIELFL